MISKTIVIAVLIAAPLSVPLASAQTWPAKTVRIIVPFAAGGASDTEARLLAKNYTDIRPKQYIYER